MIKPTILPLFIILAALSVASITQAQQTALVPMNPQPRTDKLGNEWNVEQNGMISRQGGGSSVSILGGGMMLMLGTEQFYCNQPMGSADGKEIVLMGQQPFMGVTVTRYIRFMEKEGGLRYLEQLTNTSSNDVSVTLELRQSFSGQVKQLITNLGRPTKGDLEKEEQGLVVMPEGSNATSNSWLFTVCGPRSALKPKIVSPNQYQMSFFYPVVVPAGKSVGIVHTVTQAKLKPTFPQDELDKALRSFTLARQIKDLPKGTASTVANVRPSDSGLAGMGPWYPDEILGVKRDMVDVLAMGDSTRLMGRASCAKLTLHHRFGVVDIPWNKVVALSGGRSGDAGPQVWLSDGQLLQGRLDAEELKFTLTSGLQMTLKVEELDRLVMAAPSGPIEWPADTAALIRLASGERLSILKGAPVELALATAWGKRKARLEDINGLMPSSDDGASTVASLKDGSKLRVWFGGDGGLALKTAYWGTQRVNTSTIKALITEPVTKGSEESPMEDAEPLTAFADLAGEQRLVAAPATAMINVITSGGTVSLETGSIREMRNVTEELGETVKADDGPIFQLELWGGGSVMGHLKESALSFRVQDADWLVPAREIVRFANPVPKIAENTLARIGQLLRDLGHDDWKVRERATMELTTMGELARGSLQEAFQQTEDAEVKKRIESILGQFE